MNDLKIWNGQRTTQIDTNRLHRSKCSIFLGTRMFHKDKHHMGVCKIPKPFQKVFPDVIVFFLVSFFQALASHLDQRIHMSENREKEKE